LRWRRTPTEQHSEELIDERIFRRQRITAERHAATSFTSVLSSLARLLERPNWQLDADTELRTPTDDSTERQAEQIGSFQTVVIEKFGQILDHIVQVESSAQSEAVLLPAELVTDHPEMAGQRPCQRAEQVDPARQIRGSITRAVHPPSRGTSRFLMA